MEENKFTFGEENEEIVSSTEPAKTSKKGKHYYKKKRGIAAFFQNLGIKISEFWNSLEKWKKTTIIVVTSIILVFALLLGIFLIVFDYNYNDIGSSGEDLGFSEIIDEKVVNVALFGIDARNTESFKGLSDSIMILSMNTETKKIKIISVMRDSLVPIEYDGRTSYSKINSAYQRGGPELAIKTLNKCFGIDISEYATVNFYGMTDIIDAVGGIEVNLTSSELTCKKNLNVLIKEQCKHMGISPDKYYVNQAGTRHLNGIQAVAYARIRYGSNFEGTANDQGRTERQRYVMEQLFNKATKLSKSQYVSLAKALIPCSETSLSYSEIMSLATNILLHSPTFEQSRIPHDKYQMTSKSVPRVGSCIYYDLDYAGKVLRAFIYDDIAPEDYMEQYGIEKNDWYRGSYYGGSSSSSSSSSGSTTSSKPPVKPSTPSTPSISDEPTDIIEPSTPDSDVSSDITDSSSSASGSSGTEGTDSTPSEDVSGSEPADTPPSDSSSNSSSTDTTTTAPSGSSEVR